MDTTQINQIVNEVARETLGTDDIDVIDSSSLVALGNTVLSSSSNTEPFLNTLLQRIGHTIISYRAYTSDLSILEVDNMTYGQIMQKVKTRMPIAVEDDTYNLVDGESIDMYVVSKPTASQKLFVKRTPVSFFRTTARKGLKEAFLSEQALGNFITAVFGEVQNAIELTQENLARLTIANYMVNASSNQIYDLVTMYNAATGETVPTGPSALYDEAFCRYAIATIKNVGIKMKTMSTLYNDGSETRHTPFEMQRFIYLVDFLTALETEVMYAAFNDNYLALTKGVPVPYWQAAKDPYSIKLKTEEGDEVTLENVVAIIHDRDALGTYRQEEEVLTTPVNAKGRYYNTFWHLDNLYFNDLSENGVIFTLN